MCSVVNPLSANPTRWPNTLKQFISSLPMNCLSGFDHFVKLALSVPKFSSSYFCVYRAYSRPLLSATIVPSLVPRVLKKTFSLEMGNNYTCLGELGGGGGGYKQTKCLFFRKCALKNAPMPSMSRIGSGLIFFSVFNTLWFTQLTLDNSKLYL